MLTEIRRWRARRLGPINEAIWEANGWSPAMRRFYLAAKRDPALLVDAPPGDVVLDVGAFEGGWSARVLKHVGDRDVRVLAFEPSPDQATACAARFADEPRVEVFPFGLARSTRTERLSIAGAGSSVFTDGGYGSVEVPLVDVAAALEGVEQVALAKVNIEGGEFELIDRLHETGWLGRISSLIVQFHPVVPAHRAARNRARGLLAQTHREAWCFPWIYERWDLKA